MGGTRGVESSLSHPQWWARQIVACPHTGAQQVEHCKLGATLHASKGVHSPWTIGHMTQQTELVPGTHIRFCLRQNFDQSPLNEGRFL